MAKKNGRVTRESGVSTIEDDFIDQDGPDGPHRLEREHEKKRGKEAKPGDNKAWLDPKQLTDMLETIAAAEVRIENRMEAARKNCQADRDKIKEAKRGLIDSGAPATELATLVRKHRLQRRIETIDAKLDNDQKDTFAQMVEALGGLADTPLGKAAVDRSGLQHAH